MARRIFKSRHSRVGGPEGPPCGNPCKQKMCGATWIPAFAGMTILLSALSSSAHAGNAIFFHPDGMGVNTWTAVRALKVGPDGELEWDKLPNVAIYKGHLSDGLTPSSNGGATIHAYGEKAPREAYGIRTKRLKNGDYEEIDSIAHKAIKAGKGLGLVNSGSIIEPGTGAFVARVKSRKEYETEARQIIESGAQVILSGGEEWLLPMRMYGRHGAGKRSDMQNLIKLAQDKGYTVVYDAEELAAIDPNTTPKLLGVFAAAHTFNDKVPLSLRERAGVRARKEGMANSPHPRDASERRALPEGEGIPLYEPDAPTMAQMTEKALAVLQAHHADNFLLIAEEEGTDNFGNVGNVAGQLEAGKRADDAIGTINAFIKAHPNSSVFVTSDSDAGGLQIVDCGPSLSELFTLSGCNDDYVSAPDAKGERYTFNAITTGNSDVAGGIVIRGGGKQGGLVKGTMDNTEIYTLLEKALFD